MLALIIASGGLYGTTAYGVARRTGEIGIRSALGATRRAVVAMVLSDVAVSPIGGGLVVGVPIALFASRFVESFLFGLQPEDPWALAIGVLVLAVAALVAGYIPRGVRHGSIRCARCDMSDSPRARGRPHGP